MESWSFDSLKSTLEKNQLWSHAVQSGDRSAFSDASPSEDHLSLSIFVVNRTLNENWVHHSSSFMTREIDIYVEAKADAEVSGFCQPPAYQIDCSRVCSSGEWASCQQNVDTCTVPTESESDFDSNSYYYSNQTMKHKLYQQDTDNECVVRQVRLFGAHNWQYQADLDTVQCTDTQISAGYLINLLQNAW